MRKRCCKYSIQIFEKRNSNETQAITEAETNTNIYRQIQPNTDTDYRCETANEFFQWSLIAVLLILEEIWTVIRWCQKLHSFILMIEQIDLSILANIN